MDGSCLFIAMTLLGYFPARSSSSLPVTMSPTINDQCSELSDAKANISSAIRETIVTRINPLLNTKYGLAVDRTCNCKGRGWTQVVDIDMSDPNHQCPSNWKPYNSNGIRGCSRRSTDGSCDSVVFTVGQSYSRVCGTVNAYQLGDPDGLLSAISGLSIEQSYVDGISLTYGAPGSRKHIWTFVSADNYTGFFSSHTCRCTFVNSPWPHTLPSFLGDNYYCEVGRGVGTDESIPYPNLLWDGKGCIYPDSCCEFSNPPWFCVSLLESTSEPIEARLCMNDSPSNEDLIVTLADIYVQ